MSKTGRELATALRIPGDWRVEQYTATHIPSGTEWWIGNGAMFFDKFESPRVLGYVERHILWRAMRRVIDERSASRLRARST